MSAGYERRKQRLHQRLEMLIETVAEDKDVQRLIKRLKRHQDDILTFVDYDVSPYNNHAERQIRTELFTDDSPWLGLRCSNHIS